MDGRSPITGVTVVITLTGESFVIRTLNPTGSSVQMTSVAELNPFTEYTIAVSVNNAVGAGESTSIMTQTLSLGKYFVNMDSCIF